MRLAVVGAGGRMGRTLIRAVVETDGVMLAAAIERTESGLPGKDAGTLAGLDPLGISITDDPVAAFAVADGVLDFTRPQASITYARHAAAAHCVHIIGTTGFSADDETEIAEIARSAVIVKSGNMSPGINLLAGFVRKAAATLGPEHFDIEILEMHHRHKVDAPSGTALMLGAAAAAGRNIAPENAGVRTRDGHTGPREQGTIGFAVLRGGTAAGEHSVIFAGEGERIVLSHIAEDRSIFARGAIRAALWAKGRPHGLYTMTDVLGTAV